MSGSAKRRNRGIGSQASLGTNLNDELEMHEKSRPSSAHSRNAWSDDILSGGHDEIDFSPRAPASAAVDLPSAMEREPVNHQTRVPTDVRAPGTKNVPVGCWTRFKRILRGENILVLIKTLTITLGSGSQIIMLGMDRTFSRINSSSYVTN